MFMTPALTTVSPNTSIRIVLRDSWVASEIYARLLIIRLAISSLKIGFAPPFPTVLLPQEFLLVNEFLSTVLFECRDPAC